MKMSYLFVIIGALFLFFLAVFWTVFVPYMDETTYTPSPKAIDYDLLDGAKLEEFKASIEEANDEQKERLQEKYDIHSDLLELGFTRGKVLKGRKIYMREGCYFCHTMQVRKRVVRKIAGDVESEEETKKGEFQMEPIPADKLFASYGEPSQPGDYVYDRPHLLGTERTGPDLFYEGLKRPQMAFHKEHFKAPRSKEASSIMPSFDFLSDEELEALTLFVTIPRE